MEMLVNRHTNLWRVPLPRPVRKGKTAKAKAKGHVAGQKKA